MGSDHQLSLANMKLKFKSKSKQNYPKKYAIFKLKNETTRQQFDGEIEVDLPRYWRLTKMMLTPYGKA